MNSSHLSDKLYSHHLPNKTQYVSLFTDFWLERRRSQDAIWSFLCIIFLMVLMLGIIWYYGLFNRKTKKYISVHEDTCHYTTVNKLIQAKAKLLPMFHKKKRKSKKIIEDSDVSVDTDYEDFWSKRTRIVLEQLGEKTSISTKVILENISLKKTWLMLK